MPYAEVLPRGEAFVSGEADQDAALLAEVASMLDTCDPVPLGLVEQVQFAVRLDTADVELLRAVELPQLAGARSGEAARVVTFEGDSLTIMITAERHVDGTTRIDGWLTPAACHHIELHGPNGPVATESDDAGRFSLDTVQAGTVRLVVHDAESARRIVSPAIEI